jgi:hypothetical protein
MNAQVRHSARPQMDTSRNFQVNGTWGWGMLKNFLTKVLAISGNSEHFSFKKKIAHQTLCFTEPYDNPF